MKHVDIFTDGACKGNPGPGGWGALLRMGSHEKELSGSDPETTNNRMEMTAAIRALNALIEPCDVTLHTDSRYVIDGITKWVEGWKKRGWINASKKPVRNEDLWHDLIEAAAPHTIHWQWVKGHNGHVENERVDRLASDAADSALTSSALVHNLGAGAVFLNGCDGVLGARLRCVTFSREHDLVIIFEAHAEFAGLVFIDLEMMHCLVSRWCDPRGTITNINHMARPDFCT